MREILTINWHSYFHLLSNFNVAFNHLPSQSISSAQSQIFDTFKQSIKWQWKNQLHKPHSTSVSEGGKSTMRQHYGDPSQFARAQARPQRIPRSRLISWSQRQRQQHRIDGHRSAAIARTSPGEPFITRLRGDNDETEYKR